MSETYAAALRFTLTAEGVRWNAAGAVTSSGLNDRGPADPGGLTNWGIALNRHPELTRDQLVAMDYGQAAAIWKAQYWDKIRGDEIAAISPWIAFVAFDMCAPEGVAGATRVLQRAIGFTGAAIDGELGAVTLAALKSALDRDGAHELAVEIVAQRVMGDTVKPAWPANGKGWVRRSIAAILQGMLA